MPSAFAPERLLTVSAAQPPRPAVGDGGSAALPRRRRRDRRTAPRRDRHGGGAAAVAGGGGERRAGAAAARARRPTMPPPPPPAGSSGARAAMPASPSQLVRNRRGPLGSWILQWSDSDERFLLATPAQPVAAPALDRPHRQVADRSREVSAPLVVYGKRGNAELIVAVDEAAERLGLHTGLALAQARAMHPALEAIAEDAEADASSAGKNRRLVPALHAAGGLSMRPTACCSTSAAARIFTAAKQALVADLGERIAHAGFAYTHRHRRHASAPPGPPRITASRQAMPAARNAALLAPLPLAALRLPPETVAALARVGLKRIGDIVDLPRSPLTARFGAELLRQLDRALGREHEPLNPRLPVAPYVAEQRFAEPIAREEDVLANRRAAGGAAAIRAGAARRRRAPHRAHIIPHRRRGAPHRRRHLAPVARSGTDPRAVRRAAGGAGRCTSIPASASTWRGCR